MQEEFKAPDFMEGSSAEEIHRRMMNSLPDDIDRMPGGFPYDFTKPAALEKAELLQFHLTRAIMLAFPQYAWDEWLDLHGQQAHVGRHQPEYASGKVRVSGMEGTEIPAGTVFCAQATGTRPAVEFKADRGGTIGEGGVAEIRVTAAEPGIASNVKANAISLMSRPIEGVTGVTNPEQMVGGSERESDGSYYGRIAAEYENSRTYLGNDGDYVRWAKEAGAGGCIVIPAFHGPGTVKLALVDTEGKPANGKLVQDVYQYIASPGDRAKRLLPTACAELSCAPAATVRVSYECKGILCDGTTDVGQVRKEFAEAAQKAYAEAKKEGILRYNDMRPLISSISGVLDFSTFLINGGMGNIAIREEEYPETGDLDFS